MKQFVFPTRTNSKSEWKRLLDNEEGYPVEKIVDAFVGQIVSDMNRTDFTYYPISDIGIVAPRAKSAIHGDLGARIAADLYKAHGLAYPVCVQRLKRLYVDQARTMHAEKNARLLARMPGSDEKWKEMQETPISDFVKNPVAMPVTIAKPETFAPLLACLTDDVAVQEDTQFALGHIDAMGRLDLCKQGVGEPSIVQIMAALKDNTHVHHFLLGNNVVDTVGCAAIAQTIHENHRIETYYLAGNRISETGVAVIADALRDDDVVKHLWLKRNRS